MTGERPSRLHVLCAGFVDVDKATVLTPGAGDGVRARLPVPMYLIEHGDARVLVDTGMHPRHIEDPGCTFGGSPLEHAILPAMTDEDRVERRLAQIGLRLGDVTHVVNTHLHFDHCGQNSLFGGVPIVVQREAYERAMAEDRYAVRYFAIEGLAYELVDGDVELMPGLTLLSAPGHVAGLQAVLVDLPRTGSLLLCGDAIAVREQLDTRNWLAFDDPRAAAASAAKLLRVARDYGALMLFGHDEAQWGRLRHPPASYD